MEENPKYERKISLNGDDWVGKSSKRRGTKKNGNPAGEGKKDQLSIWVGKVELSCV